MARKKATKAGKRASFESVKHKNKRVNIPTRELEDFVKEDETKPKTLLYPRDPSLDPQLVWKGKDEQDREDLKVPAVPVYIQEKIHPQALIEDLRREAQEGKPRQIDLYADFNGVQFEELIEFYLHEQNWSNRMILGDSLLVMTSLAEKEGLKGKVQMIYIDPPYGIKFGSNWQVSTRKRNVKDGKVKDASRQPEQVKAFRDTWRLGIHSYLAYLRDRLAVARELLTETGSVFVQIGDENVHLVRCLMDEVFGSENYVATISFTKTSGQTKTTLVPIASDYLLLYAKKRKMMKYRQLFSTKVLGGKGSKEHRFVELPDGTTRREPITLDEIQNPSSLPLDFRVYATGPIVSAGYSEKGSADIHIRSEGKRYLLKCGTNRHWTVGVEGTKLLWKIGRLVRQEGLRIFKRYFDDFRYSPMTNTWVDTRGETDMDYVVQTAAKVAERCLLMTTDPGDLVLDPTCGSGTTAYVAEQWGRRWITIDTSRVALALARARLMTARFPYYLLSDSPEGFVKEAEVTGQAPPASLPKMEKDVRKGFVYRREPHITLKSIANNEEIQVIHAKWHKKLEPVRAKLNKMLKRSWEEWEVPRESHKAWSKEAKELLAQWWALRKERQKEIDDSIAVGADTELLYDQPYRDPKRIRVTGPFTAESLSPHRFLSADDDLDGTVTEREARDHHDFTTMILENLKTAGVQNMVRNQRLKFDRLEPYAGRWLHADGEYTENSNAKRVAVCIGPEHGTVGPELVKEAAKEAVKGVGFDLLVVCGFAFDPHAWEAAKEFSPQSAKPFKGIVAERKAQYGKLTILLAKMNPDLAMGDELLKKTGTGNLFMVFGEPDLKVTKQKDGKLVVAIKGVDVYDPTTGQIRSHSTDDIACWFIDTDYNEESFFVRHAYFAGAEEPYDKLKRALRAEIDEAAWSALYSTKSRPFDPPKTGKIAVKVINHYGDEVLKVYRL
ncbi:site-specific DNA-methyltransferase [candidate division TA06 bacterium]|uniref:Site-specific DNA-methyltransferase n=1 Tax=candidate division TA06 bacterium TaxID=2250710 RepID=A0A523UP99_UNCT6|nr:MAG: site-specific DNA-methyltransferase [candidate division TA06 bacterium]